MSWRPRNPCSNNRSDSSETDYPQRPKVTGKASFPHLSGRWAASATNAVALGQEIHKGSRSRPQITDGIAVGKGAWMEQYAGGSFIHADPLPRCILAFVPGGSRYSGVSGDKFGDIAKAAPCRPQINRVAFRQRYQRSDATEFRPVMGANGINRPEPGIQQDAQGALLIFTDQTGKYFSLGSVQFGRPPCGPNHWTSASV